MYITMPKIASGDLLCDVGSSNLVLCGNLEGWDGVGGGRKAQEGGDIYLPVVDSCWCMVTKYCKPIIVQLKKINISFLLP